MFDIDPIKVAILAFDGSALLDFAGPLSAFRLASSHPAHAGGSPLYDLQVASLRGGPVMTADFVEVSTRPLSSLDRNIDTVIVPGGPDLDGMVAESELTAWLRAQASRSRRMAAVCTGTFLLAEAGLLDGRRAVTHWMDCERLASRYPDVAVEPDAIFVRDGPFWSSAGVTAGIDLALALIEEDYGRAVAMHVARLLVVYLRRTGGQSQHSVLLQAQAASDADPFIELETWIAENPGADLRVERLAERVAMSPRNFARRYAELRGRTPARAVEAIRVEAARRALEETSDRIEAIARRCGFSGEEQLRVAFARQLGIPPRTYRERFAI